MDEIEEFKKFLGPLAKEYNDAQLHQLQREIYAMAKLLLDMHLQKKRGTRRVVPILTRATQDATIPA